MSIDKAITFKTSDVKILILRDLKDEIIISEIALLFNSIFNMSFEEKISQIKDSDNLIVLLALHNDKIVAFKIGYTLTSKTFYSWAGGTAEHYRKLGIASTLMKIQHSLCENNGVSLIETKCRPYSVEMLSLNIKHGFEIVREYYDRNGRKKLKLIKHLRKN